MDTWDTLAFKHLVQLAFHGIHTGIHAIFQWILWILISFLRYPSAKNHGYRKNVDLIMFLFFAVSMWVSINHIG